MNLRRWIVVAVLPALLAALAMGQETAKTPLVVIKASRVVDPETGKAAANQMAAAASAPTV